MVLYEKTKYILVYLCIIITPKIRNFVLFPTYLCFFKIIVRKILFHS